MHYYNIYGQSVAVNVQLPLLNSIEPTDDCEMQIFVKYADIDGDGHIHIEESGDHYTLKLGNLAVYQIDMEEKQIVCQAKDFESFFSTLFNIPFSVYFLNKKEVLFHACSLVYDHQVFCLTGEKGIGKSTLTGILNQYEEFQIFGDDTIHIGDHSICSAAHNLMKQTPETVQSLSTKTLNSKNAAGKFYISFENEVNLGVIKKIFYISRSDRLTFTVRKVTNALRKNSIYKANVVGAGHMPYRLLTNLLKISQENLEFYELFVPNDLTYLVSHGEELKKIIMSAFDGER